jgi:crotonobetainyl-CoA:carnitine CoA-transferase CaiB-like acyl-CoA transferase
MYLADMGADVIKVESIGGDAARTWGPPFVGSSSAWFQSANRWKRSVGIDLRSAAGAEVVFRLLEDADVLLVNMTPDRMAESAFAPERVRANRSDLIYCAISAFGLDGPDAAKPAYDLIAQARSGMMSVTGPLGGMPERVGTALSDTSTGMAAALAVAGALVRKAETGLGCLIDVNLLETDLALMAPRIASYLAGEAEPVPCSGTDSVVSIYQRFETADRPIVTTVGNDSMWRRFCAAMDLENLQVPEYETNAQRREARAHLVSIIERRFRTDVADHWIKVLEEARIPVAPVLFLSEVVADDHIVARGAIRPVLTVDGGSAQVVGPPWRYVEAEAREAAATPGPAEHTREVLAESGLDRAHIDELFREGVVWGGGQN